jgi:hypothetical protein
MFFDYSVTTRGKARDLQIMLKKYAKLAYIQELIKNI